MPLISQCATPSSQSYHVSASNIQNALCHALTQGLLRLPGDCHQAPAAAGRRGSRRQERRRGQGPGADHAGEWFARVVGSHRNCFSRRMTRSDSVLKHHSEPSRRMYLEETLQMKKPTRRQPRWVGSDRTGAEGESGLETCRRETRRTLLEDSRDSHRPRRSEQASRVLNCCLVNGPASSALTMLLPTSHP